MRAICIFCCAMICFALTPVAFSQEFAGGWELRVKQHPSDADPTVILEAWAWTERDCGNAQTIISGGAFALDLSHPVVIEGFFQGYVECHLHHYPTGGAPQPYCPIATSGRWITVRGTRISVFNFLQTLGGDVESQTLYYDNPLHVMNIHFELDDLTPRDLLIQTAVSQVPTTCVDGGFAPFPIQSPQIIESQVVVHVNGTTCRADIDGDGELTIFDFLAFQNEFALGCD